MTNGHCHTPPVVIASTFALMGILLSSQNCPFLWGSLCLLNLSDAFDTIDHDILITRLSSWFGIHGSVLSWFTSYLSSRCFRVKCDNNLSSWYTSSCCVSQGSDLGPLLFIMYSIPLSTVISPCSLNHHLYADDTQLLLSFRLTDFDSCIDHPFRML